MSDVGKSSKNKKEIKYFRFAIGTFGFMLPITFLNAYSFQFYVYTIGLDAFLVSIGMFIGLASFSFGAILFGVVSDNKKPGKLGKRRPFLLLSLPGMIISVILAWFPPYCPEAQTMYWPTAIYMWVISIIFGLSASMGFAIYYSMLPEQAPSEKERVKTASIQGFFNILAVIGGMTIVMIIQSKLEDPLHTKWWEPSGQFIISWIPWISGIIAAISTITILITYISTNEDFYGEISYSTVERTNIKKSIEQTFAPLKHENNKYFLWQTIFYNMAFRLCIVLMIPFLTYVLLLQQEKYLFFFIFVAPFTIGGFFLWQNQIVKKGLIQGFSLSIKLSIIFSIFGLIFLFTFPEWITVLLGVFVIGMLVSSLLAGFLFPNPITAALVDEIKKNHNQGVENHKTVNLSGAYFGLNLFSMNFSSGIANLILGFIFIGDNAEDSTFIILTFPVIALVYGFGLYFLQKVKLK